MIVRLSGHLVEVGEDFAVVDVSGIGYEVRIPHSTRQRLPHQGEPVTFYTSLSLRQDGVTLYGFISPSELRLFDHLTGITGVGPKMALSVISSYAPDRFYHAVLNEDVTALTTIPGVGSKTAQRIILELRDRIGVSKRKSSKQKQVVTSSGDGPVEMAVEALMALGYGRNEAGEAVEKALLTPGATPQVEELITRALKTLARV